MKSLYQAVAVVVAVLGFSTSVFAAQPGAGQQLDEKYFTIGNVVVEETPQSQIAGPIIIVLPDPQQKPRDKENPPQGNPDDADVVISRIINLGKQIWQIIAANKPVVNVKTDMASAVPFGIQSWEHLSSWQMPQTREYRVRFENLYGSSVIDFTFRVLYTHGGTFKGKGAYLTNATILPAHLTVAWGYTFNATSTVAAVMNAGTDTDPVAAMQLQLDWSIDTVLKHEQSTENFYIKGDGTFKALGSSGH